MWPSHRFHAGLACGFDGVGSCKVLRFALRYRAPLSLRALCAAECVVLRSSSMEDGRAAGWERAARQGMAAGRDYGVYLECSPDVNTTVGVGHDRAWGA